MWGCAALSGLGRFYEAGYPGLHPGLSHGALSGLGKAWALEFSGEVLVEEGFLQRLQGGEFTRADEGEALGFASVHCLN